MFAIAKVGFLSNRNDFPPKKSNSLLCQNFTFIARHNFTTHTYTHTQTKSLLSDLWKA